MPEFIDSLIRPETFAEFEKLKVLVEANVAGFEKLVANGAEINRQLGGAKGIKDTNDALKQLQENEKLLAKQTDELTKQNAKLNAMYTEEAIKIAELKAQQNDRNKALKDEIALSKASEGSIEQKRIKLKQLQAAFDAMSAAERKSAVGADTLKSIRALDKELKALEGSTGRFQRNVGNYSSATKVLAESLDKVNKKLEQNAKDNKLSENAVNGLRKEQALLATFLERQEAAFSTTTQEIRENTKQLQAMAAAGLQGTEAYRRLFVATAELKDETDDLKKAIKNAAPDDVAFNAAADAARGLVGVYGLAKSASSLFGIENEELAETMVKLQAAETALQSIEAIRAVFKKENAVRQAINIGLQRVEILQTNLQTASESKNIVVKYASAAAQRVLNAVMMANPIMLMVGALALLVTALVSFTSATDKAKLSLQGLNNGLKENIELDNKRINNIQSNGKIIVARMEAEGKTAEEISAAKIEALKKEAMVLKQRDEQYAASAAVAKLRLEQDKKNIRGITDKDKEAAKELLSSIEDIRKRRKELNDEIILEELSAQKELREKRAEEFKKRKEQEENDAKERAAKRKEFAERERKAQFDLTRLKLEDSAKELEAIANNDKVGLDARLDALEKFQTEQEAIINLTRDFELGATGQLESEKKVIRERAASAINDLQEKTAERGLQILKDNLSAEEAEIAASIEKRKAQLEKEQTQKQNRLARDRDVALLNADGEQARIAIQKQFVQDSLNLELDYYETLAQYAEEFGLDITDIERKIAEARLKIKQQATQESEAEENKMIEAAKRLANEVLNAFQSAITGGYDRQKNAIQDQINLLEEQKRKDIEVANSQVQTAEQRAANIAIINARAQADRERLERRQRQLDLQKARVDRIFTIGRIVADTAAAVVKALPNIPLSILMGAIGAAQLVKVLATPLPSFRKGTTDAPGGLSLVHRNELIVTPSGKLIRTGNTPEQLINLEKHSIVYPDERRALENGVVTNRITNSGSGTNGAYKEMTSVLGGKIDTLANVVRHKKEVHRTITHSGMTKLVKYGYNWVEYEEDQTNWK